MIAFDEVYGQYSHGPVNYSILRLENWVEQMKKMDHDQHTSSLLGR